MASLFHCQNIFKSTFTHVGVAGSGNYWAMDFARLFFTSGSKAIEYTNPIYDGVHYVHATRTGGKLRFLANYYTQSLEIPKVRGEDKGEVEY